MEDWNLKKNKIIAFIITIVIFVLFIVWTYIRFNGIPWKVKQMEVSACTYLNEKYPSLQYKVNKSSYNSRLGYHCDIVTKEDLPISFIVTVRGNKTIKDNYFEMKVNTEAKNMVVDLIENSIPTIKQISVLSDAGATAAPSSYEKYTSFVPGMAYPLKIDIIWTGDKMSLETFVDKALTVREILKNKNISVCGLYIQDKNNGYVISLNGGIINGKTEGNYDLSKDEIIKSKAAYKMK